MDRPGSAGRHGLAPRASVLERMVVAVLFAFLGTVVFFPFLRRVSLRSSLLVPIVGVMLGSVTSAVSTFFALMTDMRQALGVRFQGSVTSVYRGQYEVLWLVLVVVLGVLLYADRLTAAGLGEDLATSIGVDCRRTVLLGAGLVSVATGAVTVVVGSLPFRGSSCPHHLHPARGRPALQPALGCAWWVPVWSLPATCCPVPSSPFEVLVAVVLLGAAVLVVLIVRGSEAS